MQSQSHSRWLLDTVWEAGWAPTLVFCVHVVASRVFHAYLRFPALDIPMHFSGGLAIAYFLDRGVVNVARRDEMGPIARGVRWALVFALTCTATVLWEFSEFISDRFLETHAQLGLDDTLSDMLFGILGGLAFQIFCRGAGHRRLSSGRPASKTGGGA